MIKIWCLVLTINIKDKKIEKPWCVQSIRNGLYIVFRVSDIVVYDCSCMFLISIQSFNGFSFWCTKSMLILQCYCLCVNQVDINIPHLATRCSFWQGPKWTKSQELKSHFGAISCIGNIKNQSVYLQIKKVYPCSALMHFLSCFLFF